MRQPPDDARTERTPDEARQSIETGHMRYVLGVSLLLAVIAMAAALVLT